jgi:hypothetical protein
MYLSCSKHCAYVFDARAVEGCPWIANYARNPFLCIVIDRTRRAAYSARKANLAVEFAAILKKAFHKRRISRSARFASRQ